MKMKTSTREIIGLLIIVVLLISIFSVRSKYKKLNNDNIEKAYIKYTATKDSLDMLVWKYGLLSQELEESISNKDTIIKNIIKVYEEKLIAVDSNNTTADISFYSNFIEGWVSEDN